MTIQYYHDQRNTLRERALGLSIERVEQLPDELIRLIWSYTDNETKLHYFMGKYPLHVLHQRLSSLTCPVLKKLIHHTCYCYEGHAMKKELMPYHKKIPPSSHLNKQEKINEIVRFLTNMMDAYFDEKVMITKSEKGQKIKKIVDMLPMEDEERMEYMYRFSGTLYPMAFYEKNALQLWKHVVVALHLFTH